MLPKMMRVPYGFNLEGNELTEDEHEQEMIALMLLWRERDNLSYDNIAIQMNSLNEPTKRGHIWGGAVVNKILKREGVK